jgi:hypothetical protein
MSFSPYKSDTASAIHKGERSDIKLKWQMHQDHYAMRTFPGLLSYCRWNQEIKFMLQLEQFHYLYKTGKSKCIYFTLILKYYTSTNNRKLKYIQNINDCEAIYEWIFKETTRKLWLAIIK